MIKDVSKDVVARSPGMVEQLNKCGFSRFHVRPTKIRRCLSPVMDMNPEDRYVKISSEYFPEGDIPFGCTKPLEFNVSSKVDLYVPCSHDGYMFHATMHFVAGTSIADPMDPRSIIDDGDMMVLCGLRYMLSILRRQDFQGYGVDLKTLDFQDLDAIVKSGNNSGKTVKIYPEKNSGGGVLFPADIVEQ